MRNLRGNLTQKELQEVFDVYGKYSSLEKASAYLNRVIDANFSVVKGVLSMSDAVRDAIIQHLEEDGSLARILEKTKRATALEMLKDGFAPEKIARYVQMPLEWVQSLAR